MGTTPVARSVSAIAPPGNPEWKPVGDDQKDTQGLIISAYPHLDWARFIEVSFPVDIDGNLAVGVNAKGWMTYLSSCVTDSTGKRDQCVNVALSAHGMRLLGVPES